MDHIGAALRRRGRPEHTAPLQLFCDDVARRLRTGASLTAAVVDTIDAAERSPHAGAPHPVLVAIAHRASVGDPLAEAARIATTDHPDADVQLVAHVLAVAADHGGAPAEAIDRAASTLRERAALRAERHAQSASARLSTRVMTALPVAFTGFVAATDPDVRHVLLRTPIGWGCLATGLALNLAGRAWARRLLIS